MKKKALISVYDKTGIVELSEVLCDLGYEIVSTGGTANLLEKKNIKVTKIEELTGSPECLNGRVKTLQFKIYGGILADRSKIQHIEQLKMLDIGLIDVVVVNLYPFLETVNKRDCTLEDAIENIDIGGVTLIRAAAKNYKDVLIITDVNDYNNIIEALKNNNIDNKIREKLMVKAFQKTAGYDSLINIYFRKKFCGKEYFTEVLNLTYNKFQNLRYGENPNQSAAFYKFPFIKFGELTNAEILNGKELSYNNIADASSAIMLIKEFEEPSVVAIKHSTPCAVASDEYLFNAYLKAYNSDPVSIFGGVVAFNKKVDQITATELNKIFLEIVIAPDFDEKALEILKSKKNLRILQLPEISRQSETEFEIKTVSGGILIQNPDNILLDESKIEYVTNRKPTGEELKDMFFAWKVVKHTKSNAIVIARNRCTLGIGTGQTSRVWSTENAIKHSRTDTTGSVLASDAFFPFPDSVELAADAGITSIIQPGGSIKDKDSVTACNKHNIAMIFTKIRHFKH